jgi:predicted RNA binding protein YcfA (HicA-like mRNA interferase family)
MPRLPLLSGREIIKALYKIGYRQVRQRGSHIRLYSADKNPVTVPDYKTVGRGLLRKILRDVEIPVSEFRKLLK